MQLAAIDILHADAAWAKEPRPEVARMVEGRLDRLVDWIGDRDFSEECFTAGDLLMASVLRILDHTDLVATRLAAA